MTNQEVIKIPELLFRGRKIYLESWDIKSDGVVVKQFISWIEHYTENIVKDSSFYHLKAKQFLEKSNTRKWWKFWRVK